MTPPDIITRYADAFAGLTPDTMDRLMATVSADVRFVDPFNDVTGRDGFRAIFEPYHVRVDAMPGELDLANNGITRVYDGNLAAATYLHERGDESKADKNRKISAAPPAFLASGWEPPKPVELPLEAWRPDMQEFVQNGYISKKLARVAEAEVQLKKLKLDKTAQERKRAKSEGIRPVKGEAILTDDFRYSYRQSLRFSKSDCNFRL